MSASRLNFKSIKLLCPISLLAILLGWLGALPCLAGNSVLLVLSGTGDVYVAVTQGFQDAIGHRLPVRSVSVDGLSPHHLRPPSGDDLLIVPVGMRAAQFVADNAPPGVSVLALLVPMQSFTSLNWPAVGGPRSVSAVYIDQPLHRSLHLIALLDARLNRVGMLVSTSEGNGAGANALVQEGHAIAQGLGKVLMVRTVENGKSVGEGLRALLPYVDVLLLVPDDLVANTANVQSVLLTSYRYRVPVVGFSPGLVTAGAVAAVYSAPLDIGREGAAMALAWNLATGELPAARYAGGFELAINERVARSLGLALPDPRQLRRKLLVPRRE